MDTKTSAQQAQQSNRDSSGKYLEGGCPKPESNSNSLIRNFRATQPGVFVNASTGFSDEEFATMRDCYFVMALDAGNRDGNLNGTQTILQFDDSTFDQADADLFIFLSENRDLIDQARNTGYGSFVYGISGSIGADFWHTRNREDVGFASRPELREDGLGDMLAEAARKFRPLSARTSNGEVIID
jgi:hypothetical protein